MVMLQWLVASKALVGLGAAALIGGGLIWGIQDWRLRGERIETLKVQNGIAGERIATAVGANLELQRDAAAAAERHRLDLQMIRDREVVLDGLRRGSEDRRAAARDRRGGDADGPVAPVVLDWLRRVRRPDAGPADGRGEAGRQDRGAAGGPTPLLPAGRSD